MRSGIPPENRGSGHPFPSGGQPKKEDLVKLFVLVPQASQQGKKRSCRDLGGTHTPANGSVLIREGGGKDSRSVRQELPPERGGARPNDKKSVTLRGGGVGSGGGGIETVV